MPKYGRCQYKRPLETCKRKPLPGSKYCICHERGYKELDMFNEEVGDIMKKKETKWYDFSGFYFPENFNFKIIYDHLKDRTFDKPVDFFDATFKKETDFSSANFQDKAIFIKTKFRERVSFLNTKFREVSFVSSKFWKDVDFRSAIFQEKVFFLEDTRFRKDADFREAVFEKQAYFLGVIFQKFSDFRFVKFKNIINFSYYLDTKNQIRTTKFKEVSFHRAIFEKRADFENCEIEEKIDFQNAQFHDELSLTNINGYQEKKPKDVPIFDFRNTRFSDTTRIDRGTKLHKALFRLDSVERVDFSGAEFPDKIFEEELLEKKYAYKGVENEYFNEEEKEYCPRNWDEVSSIYRKLKQAHQRYGYYDIAGDFFYREMECKKKGTPIKQFKQWAWLHFLSIACGYGEKPWKVLRNSFGVILFYAFLYLITNSIAISGKSMLEDVFQSIYFSAITFTTLGYGYIYPTTNPGRFLAMSEAFIGAIFIALFIFVFGRKMMR